MITTDRTQAQIRVLLAEDDPDDAHLVRKTLQRRAEPIFYEHVTNGLAVKKLLEERRGQRRVLPELIILDLNMPLMNGMEVLEWMRGDRDFDAVVVIVFTTSTDEKVLSRAKQLGANGALSKDMQHQDQQLLGQMFVDYWFHGTVQTI